MFSITFFTHMFMFIPRASQPPLNLAHSTAFIYKRNEFFVSMHKSSYFHAIFMPKINPYGPTVHTRIHVCKQTHTQKCELLYNKMRLFFLSHFPHIYRLVCVSFLINRLNSWLFHQYKFWRAIESFSLSLSHVHMSICVHGWHVKLHSLSEVSFYFLISFFKAKIIVNFLVHSSFSLSSPFAFIFNLFFSYIVSFL